MKKHLKLIGIAILLIAVVVACGNKKDKEDLKAAIEKADGIIKDNKLAKSVPFFNLHKDLKADRDELVGVIDDAKKVLDDKKGDYKAALDKVNDAIKGLEDLADKVEEAKSNKGIRGEGRMGGGGRTAGPRAGGMGAGANQQPADQGGAATTTTQKVPSNANTKTTKKAPGGRLRNR